MIKLFSLNHTRTRKFLILAQDKTQFRRVTVLIFRVRNTSASAHTNYLVNFLKSVWAVAQSRPRILHRSAALSTVYFSLFSLPKTAEKLSGLLPVSRCAFYTEPPSCQPLSEVFLKHFLQRFQAVIARVSALFSDLPLKRDAHSTDLSRGVNGQSEKISDWPKRHDNHSTMITRAIFFLPAWMTHSSPATNMRWPSNCWPST